MKSATLALTLGALLASSVDAAPFRRFQVAKRQVRTF